MNPDARLRRERLVRGGGLAVLALLAVAQSSPVSAQSSAQPPAPASAPPYAAESGGSLPRVFRELRRCIGPLAPETERKFVGVRWLCNGFEILHATAREALRSVAGLTFAPGEQPEENALARRIGDSREEQTFLQLIAPSMLYGWSGTDTTPGTVSGAATDSEGRVLQASTSGRGIQSWQDFQQNVIPITENPYGRGALFRLAVLNRAANVREAVGAVLPPGGVSPEFEGERQDSQSSGGRSITTNNVVRTAVENAIALTVAKESPQTLVAAQQGPILEAARTNPSVPIPDPLRGARAQEAVASVAFGDLTAGSAGKAVELSGLGFPPTSIAPNLIARDALDALAQRIAGGIQSSLNNLANALNFFGPAAGGLGNLFGPENLSNLASANLPSGPGGPQRLSDIPAQESPPEEPCTGRTPNISVEEARGAAVVLGILGSDPAAVDPNTPLQTRYVPAQRVYNTQGQNAFTGQREIIGPAQFPDPNACVWAVQYAPPGAPTEVVLLEDVPSPSGVRTRLTLP